MFGADSALSFRLSFAAALVIVMGVGVGCEPPTPPTEAPRQYDQLIRVAAAQAKARPDTSFFWFRNTRNAQGRSLMLDLGVDFLYFNRAEGVLCVWNGEGLWPARGYVTMLPDAKPLTDSVGGTCNIDGTCSSSPLTETWAQFRCVDESG